jgi:hypothetical protein
MASIHALIRSRTECLEANAKLFTDQVADKVLEVGRRQVVEAVGQGLLISVTVVSERRDRLRKWCQPRNARQGRSRPSTEVDFEAI